MARKADTFDIARQAQRKRSTAPRVLYVEKTATSIDLWLQEMIGRIAPANRNDFDTGNVRGPYLV
jgi:hypothetical protein